MAIDLPAISDILVQVRKELESPDPDGRRIVELIGRDPGLAKSVLQVVNSPVYGLPSKIASIGRAVNLLGLETVRTAIIVPTLENAFPKPGPFSTFLWKRSLLTALSAGQLARRVVEVDREQAYLVGLFHDTGSLVLAQHHPDFEVLFDLARTSGSAMGQIEQVRYGRTHVQISARLAHAWDLPPVVCEAVGRQDLGEFAEVKSAPVRRLVAVLHLVLGIADSLTPYPGQSVTRATASVERQLHALNELEVRLEDFGAISEELHRELAADAAEFLGDEPVK